MRLSKTLAATATLAIMGIAGNSARGIQLQDGTVWFDKSPSLVTATTTFKDANVWGATYYFTIALPENAGEPLQRVTIAEVEGMDDIRYRLGETSAFEGAHWNTGKRLDVGEVTMNRESRTVTVTLSPPVPPGKTVTIGLNPVQNPFNDGVYLFGVTAFPAGEKSHGLYLGVGRLQFYRDR